MSNRAQRRFEVQERSRKAGQLFLLKPGVLEPVVLAEWPHPVWMTRAWRNNRYTVMERGVHPTTHGPAVCVLVQRHDDQPIPRHWSELQAIKNELYGPETMAIEYYPPQSELVDEHNIYWMWIYPDGVIPKPTMA